VAEELRAQTAVLAAYRARYERVVGADVAAFNAVAVPAHAPTVLP
jgi:hypothetical protein